MCTVRKDCIWIDQCGHMCSGECDDFSPIDSSDEDEAYYSKILKENTDEYFKLIQEFIGEGEI